MGHVEDEECPGGSCVLRFVANRRMSTRSDWDIVGERRWRVSGVVYAFAPRATPIALCPAPRVRFDLEFQPLFFTSKQRLRHSSCWVPSRSHAAFVLNRADHCSFIPRSLEGRPCLRIKHHTITCI